MENEFLRPAESKMLYLPHYREFTLGLQFFTGLLGLHGVIIHPARDITFPAPFIGVGRTAFVRTACKRLFFHCFTGYIIYFYFYPVSKAGLYTGMKTGPGQSPPPGRSQPFEK